MALTVGLPLDYCPCCEGSGAVPSASGLTDDPCLCRTLDGNDRVILHGRADTLAWWESQLRHIADPYRRTRYEDDCEHLRSTMIHLVAGCEGPCRGNSSPTPRCNL